ARRRIGPPWHRRRLRSRQRERARRPPRAGAGDRQQRMGPARASTDAREPRGGFLVGHHRRHRNTAGGRERAGGSHGSMTNILAIAQKELKAYFSSPIAYIVIGFWSLLYGYFFVAILSFFVRQSMQMNQFGMQGPQSMNINQQLIRPLLQNVNILVLFLMPMVTMRTYAEEKRSGTIELLLTSPWSDFQLIMGKFLGAMALYGLMLAVTMVHIALLFVYGRPELKPILKAYLGMLLVGGCFI